MALKYLAGERIIGTAAERAAMSTALIPATTNPHWQILGRATANGSTALSDTGVFTAKDYIMIIINGWGTSGEEYQLNFNDQTYLSGSGQYNTRYNYTTGSADSTSQANWNLFRLQIEGGSGTRGGGYIGTFNNQSGQEKYGDGWSVRRLDGGASQAVEMNVFAHQWEGTDQITRCKLTYEGNDLATPSEIVVLGYNASDTTGTAAWELLKDYDLPSDGDTFASGSFTAKKYLWIQTKLNDTGGTIYPRMSFNSDNSGGNYAFRMSKNGGAYAGGQSQNTIADFMDATACPIFINTYIINNASKEKAVLSKAIGRGSTTESGEVNRSEVGAKWSDTSNQVTQVVFENTGAGSFEAGSNIKVWGFD